MNHNPARTEQVVNQFKQVLNLNSTVMKLFLLMLYLTFIFPMRMQTGDDRSEKYLSCEINDIRLFNTPAGNNLTDTFIIIDQSKIYYRKKGSGSTPVVFVSGLAEDHTTWQTVQDSIAMHTISLSYDRTGLGKSTYHGEKKDLHSMAVELNRLIKSTLPLSPLLLLVTLLVARSQKNMHFSIRMR